MNDDTPPIRFLVLGPANSGKSTLVGHLLYRCGNLGPEMKQLLREQRYWQAQPYSQLLETLRDPGKRATAFGLRYYKSPRYEVIIGNSPGDSCGMQATCVVFVVSAAEEEFEAARGQIQNQLRFVWHLRGKHTIVCVNKMDATRPPYSDRRFGELLEVILGMLQGLDRNLKTLDLLPISALDGDNLYEASRMMLWLEYWWKLGSQRGRCVGVTLHQLLGFIPREKLRQDRRGPDPGKRGPSVVLCQGLNREAVHGASWTSAHPQGQPWPSAPGPSTGVRGEVWEQGRGQGGRAAWPEERQEEPREKERTQGDPAWGVLGHTSPKPGRAPCPPPCPPSPPYSTTTNSPLLCRSPSPHPTSPQPFTGALVQGDAPRPETPLSCPHLSPPFLLELKPLISSGPFQLQASASQQPPPALWPLQYPHPGLQAPPAPFLPESLTQPLSPCPPSTEYPPEPFPPLLAPTHSLHSPPLLFAQGPLPRTPGEPEGHLS